MYKDFTYKGITITVKTNFLLFGKTYFGDVDIQKELEATVRLVEYGRSGDTTQEQFIMNIYKELLAKKIRVDSVRLDHLKYVGTQMTNHENTLEYKTKHDIE